MTASVLSLTASVDDVGGCDTSLTNNALTGQTTVNSGVDLGIELAFPMPATAPAGSRVPITLTVETFGPDTADKYEVEFPVPPGLDDVTFPSECSLSAGTFTYLITNELLVGDVTVLSFYALIVVAGGSDVTATASVRNGDPGDSISANNTSTQTLTVTEGIDITASGPPEQHLANNTDSGTTAITDPKIDLAAVKTGPSPPLGVQGQPYDFDISARNDGNADVFGTAVLTDVLPVGLTLDAIDAPAG